MEAKTLSGEGIYINDKVLYEMHSGSRFLYPAVVKKILNNGVLLEDKEGSVIIDAYNIFKKSYPKFKKIMN